MRNVILISIDDIRFDCIGICGNKSLLKDYISEREIKTPNIDAIASKGIYFPNAYSISSYTPAAHATMLTGVYPARHGIRTFFGSLAPSVPNLAEIFRDIGFRTFARVEHHTLSLLGITRGFDYLDDIAEESHDSIFNTLRANRGDRNFIFIHLMDVHKPYFFAKGRERKQFNSDYLNRIHQLANKYSLNFHSLLRDAEKEARRVVTNFKSLSNELKEHAIQRSVFFLLRKHLGNQPSYISDMFQLYVEGVNKFDQGKFKYVIEQLNNLGLLEEAFVVITSDHGETHTVWNGVEDLQNTFTLANPSVRVPLIFWDTHKEHQRISDDLISIADIVPSILDVLEIPVPQFDFDGKSFFSWSDGRDECRKYAYFETWAYQGGVDQFGNVASTHRCFCRQKGAVHKTYKYVETGERIKDIKESQLLDNKSNREFIDDLYQKILGRYANELEIIYFEYLLCKGLISRTDLINRFLTQTEKIGIKAMLYEVSDIAEKNNLINKPEMSAVVEDFQKIIDFCSSSDLVEMQSNDEEILINRLKALGYIE